MNVVMNILEFLFGLFELAELISTVCEMFRAAGRLVRWIIEPQERRRGTTHFQAGKVIGCSPEAEIIFSPTRRRSRRRRGPSAEVR